MKEKRQCKNLKKNLAWVFSVCCLIAAALFILVPANAGNSGESPFAKYCSVEKISELTTLKGYYHNVAVFEKKPEGIEETISTVLLWPLNELIRPGYKRFWIEYNGTIEYGVDANQVQINKPDPSSGIVDIYVPDAKVFNVDGDENSMTMPISETGLLVSISGDDRGVAYAAAQKKMKEEAENDQALMKRAKENVKALLEKYITNLGDGSGVQYKVNWIDSPKGR